MCFARSNVDLEREAALVLTVELVVLISRQIGIQQPLRRIDLDEALLDETMDNRHIDQGVYDDVRHVHAIRRFLASKRLRESSEAALCVCVCEWCDVGVKVGGRTEMKGSKR